MTGFWCCWICYQTVVFLQAEVEGQKITWLTPHALQQVLPEVDYRVLLTFLEFYEVSS